MPIKVKYNPKKFCTFVNVNDKKVDLPRVMHFNEVQASTGLNTVNLLAQHFSSIFTDTPLIDGTL